MAHSTLLSVPWGSAGFRGVPWLSVVPVIPLSSLLDPLCRPAYKWKAFRNHRNGRYWETEEERRKRERKSGETRKIWWI